MEGGSKPRAPAQHGACVRQDQPTSPLPPPSRPKTAPLVLSPPRYFALPCLVMGWVVLKPEALNPYGLLSSVDYINCISGILERK
jgi:hypothetical protein